MEVARETIRLTEADFFSGIFAALFLKGYKTISFDAAFEAAMAEEFQALMDSATEQGVELNFRIRLHPLHGYSLTIHRNIFTAVQRGVITLGDSGKMIRIQLTEDAAKALLDGIAGKNLLIKFTDKVIDILLGVRN